MSQFYDSASLVMIPSGVKDGKVYSQKPLSADGQLTFSRASTATRVASNGYIEKAKVNLLLQSNSFSTTWTNTRSTESSGYAGYDGTNNAWKLEEDSNTGTHKIQQSINTTGIVSASIYAKSAERSALQFLIESGGSYAGANFNLADGSVQSTFSATFTLIEAKVSNVGSGWYRLSFSANVTSSAAFTIYTLDAGFNTSYTGTTGEGVYIQDAQVNYGLVAQDYVETTTTSVVSGITNDMPRLDYSGGASCPSLLLEPQRTNLVTQSEYIENWSSQTGITVSSNETVSPEGLINATKIETSSAGSRYVGNNYTLATGNNTFSVFAKKGSTNWIYLNVVQDGANNWNFTFDLENGTLGQSLSSAYSVTASIEDYGSGWYRITATANVTSAGLFTARIYPADSATDVSTSIGDNVYIYGAQLEAGSYPTSYIPTYGTTVTRLADSCSKTGISSLIGQTEGTIFADVTLTSRSSFSYFALAPNLASTSAYIGVGITSSAFSFEVVNSGVQVAYNFPTTSTGRFKIAFAYKANDFVAYVNGVKVHSDTSGTVPACSQFGLNAFSSTAAWNYNQALLFKTRLSNADLATLTA